MPRAARSARSSSWCTFDDKLQPAEALIALKSVTDQNIPFVMHCVGSNVGAALIDARVQAQRAQSRQPRAAI